MGFCEELKKPHSSGARIASEHTGNQFYLINYYYYWCNQESQYGC